VDEEIFVPVTHISEDITHYLAAIENHQSLIFEMFPEDYRHLTRLFKLYNRARGESDSDAFDTETWLVEHPDDLAANEVANRVFRFLAATWDDGVNFRSVEMEDKVLVKFSRLPPEDALN
jgi:hypothetical protein